MAEKYKTGIETMPLKVFDKAPRMIMVFVHDLSVDPDEQETIVRQLELDFSKFDDRKHLGQLTYWAITNNHSVETMSVESAKGESK